MKYANSIFGLSVAAFFAISIIAVSATPDVFAKPSGNGQPDLVATLTSTGSGGDPKGKAMFWFDGESEPTSIRYQIVLNQVDVKGNPGKGLENLLEKVHVHYAPNGVHHAMHLYNILGPADDLDDGKIAGKTLSGVWDEADIDEHWAEHMHHSSKPLDAVNPNGNTVLENLCTENSDVNIHLVGGEHPYIRGIIETNSNACENLGF